MSESIERQEKQKQEKQKQEKQKQEKQKQENKILSQVKQTVKKELSVKIPRSHVVFSREELYHYKPKLKHVEYTIYN